MRTSFLVAPLACLFLIGCTSSTNSIAPLSLQQHLDSNPLFALRYWEEMTDRLANLHVQKDPLLQDKTLAKIADDNRVYALEKAKEVNTVLRGGQLGSFNSVAETITGNAYFRDHTLYLGSDFMAYPGPALHFFLSTDFDPSGKEVEKPGNIDLGIVRNPYGEDTYIIPKTQDTSKIQSLIMWDTRLKRMFGFSQLIAY